MPGRRWWYWVAGVPGGAPPAYDPRLDFSDERNSQYVIWAF